MSINILILGISRTLGTLLYYFDDNAYCLARNLIKLLCILNTTENDQEIHTGFKDCIVCYTSKLNTDTKPYSIKL